MADLENACAVQPEAIKAVGGLDQTVDNQRKSAAGTLPLFSLVANSAVEALRSTINTPSRVGQTANFRSLTEAGFCKTSAEAVNAANILLGTTQTDFYKSESPTVVAQSNIVINGKAFEARSTALVFNFNLDVSSTAEHLSSLKTELASSIGVLKDPKQSDENKVKATADIQSFVDQYLAAGVKELTNKVARSDDDPLRATTIKTIDFFAKSLEKIRLAQNDFLEISGRTPESFPSINRETRYSTAVEKSVDTFLQLVASFRGVTGQ